MSKQKYRMLGSDEKPDKVMGDIDGCTCLNCDKWKPM